MGSVFDQTGFADRIEQDYAKLSRKEKSGWDKAYPVAYNEGYADGRQRAAPFEMKE